MKKLIEVAVEQGFEMHHTNIFNKMTAHYLVNSDGRKLVIWNDGGFEFGSVRGAAKCRPSTLKSVLEAK